jgi:release factor glutamine methyltransferase
LNHLTGLTRTDILSEKKIELDQDQNDRLRDFLQRINLHEPIQYILGEAEFYGRRFTVQPGVLIPRPETEELVKLALQLAPKISSRVLDIGTGSGCIPITLKLECPNSEVFATDISDQALLVSRQNARHLRADVKFFKSDILKEPLPVADLDIVISNPPYITEGEKAAMSKNVLDHEPSLALFVSDNDPLIFYRGVAVKAFDAMKNDGILLTEINERFGKEVKNLFTGIGYSEVEVVKDLFGKDRIVKGKKCG